MKTNLLWILFLFISAGSYAQYCGNSGAVICSPSGTLINNGFSPNEDISCIVRGQPTGTTIQFKNYSNIVFGGQTLSVNSLTFDTLSNLPSGLCWATNKPNNSYVNNEDGCIKLSGTTFAAPGVYKVYGVVTLDIGIPIQTNMDALPARLLLRVQDGNTGFCPPVDTSQTTPYEPFSTNYSNIAQISGRIYVDQNQNNQFDAGEIGVPNQLVNVGSNQLVLSNAAGNYTAYVDTSNYVLSPMLSAPYDQFSFTPSSYNVNANVPDTLYGSNNFGLTIPSTWCMASLSITPNFPPRPGFDNFITLNYANQLSGAAVSQNVRLYYNAFQTYVSASPAPAVVDSVNNYVEWTTTPVNPGTQWLAQLTLHTGTGVPLGTVFSYDASINNSSCSANDTLTAHHEAMVVGSWDPNDKAVSPVGYGSQHYVLPGSAVDYTIRFQNTGTFAAQDITVVDTLSNYLDPLSLKVLAASHDYDVLMQGQTIKFLFKNINLPDSNANEPQSHGYVQFSVKPKTGTPNGALVSNLADIYFDFNAPVRTNAVYNTFDVAAAIRPVANSLQLSVYPNPSMGNWHIETTSENIGKDVKLFSLDGRLIYQSKVSASIFNIEVPNLAAGIYTLKVGDSLAKLVCQ